jgi:N6-adenosine-specific RNA methylase IME4
VKRPQADNLPLPPFPAGKFACASIDFPWHFETRAPTRHTQSMRSPQRHYPTMDLDYIERFPLRDVLAPDAWVAIWMTGPLLVMGVQVRLAKAFGLRLSSMGFIWIKTRAKFDMDVLARSPLLDRDLHMSTGYTTRQNAEYVVLARCGSPRRLSASVRQLIIAPVSDHSRKPDDFFKRMEAFCEGPRIDMFAGAERPGWTSWGTAHREGERSDAA